MKHPQKQSFTKHDMRRAMTNMFMHIKSLENKINDIDILFA